MTAPGPSGHVRRPTGRGRLWRVGVALFAVAFVAAGCSGGPILANAPIVFPSAAIPTVGPARPADPVPILLPRDDGPHDRLTEWWYYTGHLSADNGRRFGFEAVVFRAERGSTPVAWASHLALTDETGSRFYYAQRSEVGPQVDQSPRDGSGTPTGFNLNIGGLNPALIAAGAPARAAPWRLNGSNGTDRIEAALAPEEASVAGASFGLRLDLDALKPAVRHRGNGFIDFGPAGSSYYYSRTRLAASGELQLNGETLQVTGIAWFDHQWGDFVSVGAGGWDWFAINLDDGTDITLSSVLDEHSVEVLQYGTLVRPSGEIVDLQAPYDFGIGTGFGGWTSPATGVTYPSGWRISMPPSPTDAAYPQCAESSSGTCDRIITLDPTVADQELDTRATTGVAYWEGSQTVDVLLYGATGAGATIGGGRAYVEITRYDAPGG